MPFLVVWWMLVVPAWGTATKATEVVVIGAGAAGLESADLLRRAHIPHLVLEAEARAGGRLQSRPDQAHMGLILDEGPNLINSDDTVALELLERFHIPYVRRFQSDRDSMHFLIQGRHLTQAEADAYFFASDGTAFQRIERDQKRAQDETSIAFHKRLTRTSIAEYLTSQGVSSQFSQLVDSFFWSEYGRHITELNVHVLFDYLLIDTKDQRFKFIPYFDEAFQVPGGTGQLAAHLEKQNRSHILYQHRVTRVESLADDHLLVEAETPQGTVSVTAKHVIFAAPLHRVNEMNIRVRGLHRRWIQMAGDMTYGQGVKLHLKFAAGFRDLFRFSGILLTETGEQIWVSSTGQGGQSGLLTVLTGPLPWKNDQIHGIQAEAYIQRLLSNLEVVAPGVSALYVGFEQTDAPFSYSGALRPGYGPKEALQDVQSIQWISVGEASGGFLQGYLEGALRSAKERTSWLIQKIKPCHELLIGKRKKAS